MTKATTTKEEFLASRKAAGRLIDVGTCKIWAVHCDMGDPYGCGPGNPGYSSITRIIFVRSAESDGPVCQYDLPEDKRRALRARIDRAGQLPTTAEGVRDVLLEEYACAVAALDGVIEDVVDDRLHEVPLDIVRSGVRLALAALGKEGTSQEKRLEQRFRAELEGGNELPSS